MAEYLKIPIKMTSNSTPEPFLIDNVILPSLSIISNEYNLSQPWRLINSLCFSVVFLIPSYAVLHSTTVPST